MRKLEAVFAVLIATMALSFAWMFFKTKPNGKDIIIGVYLSLLHPLLDYISLVLLFSS